MPVLDCTTPCALAELKKGSDCNDTPGIDWGYWGLRSSIASVAVTDGVITGYTMEASEFFYGIDFDIENSSYVANYNEDNAYYEHTLTMNLLGKSAEQRKVISDAIKCCNIVWHLGTAGCHERVVGIEIKADDSIHNYFKPLRIGEHEDNQGERGGERSRDLLTFTGKSLKPALFAEVGEDSIPTDNA